MEKSEKLKSGLNITHLQISQWLNSPSIMTETLIGRVVVVHAFQMLCPGCVSHGVPLMADIQRHFASRDVFVMGLHTVFEHHHAMTPAALEVFLHEYRINYPVAVDQASADGDPRPMSMRAFALRGTPSLLIFNADGQLAHHGFGAMNHLAIGATIAELITGQGSSTQDEQVPDTIQSRCTDEGCAI